MARYPEFNAAAVSVYSDDRMQMTIYPLDRSGNINLSLPISRYSNFFLQSVQEPDMEKVQVALASDAPKMYTFGTQHKFYTYQGVLLDTDLDGPIEVRDGQQISIWTGRGYNEWQLFYSQASLSNCAKNRYVVELQYPSKRIYGAITQMSVSADSAQPNRYDAVFSFFVIASQNIYVE